MELLAPFNFKVVGFTDSTLFKDTGKDISKVQDFIQDCEDKLGVMVELKTVFINSILS